ncbi:hypothetical protein LCGC14_1436770 [marine sediment metagenome]|uniref:Uncharacterized protein n=1 Tax=marine sediment metagenome TaxID=412755 RepID=A0A0F9JMH9_9ZZZZ|nr:hypothetical protein [archaeon]HEC38416.1 hypothetical protein [bacterium]
MLEGQNKNIEQVLVTREDFIDKEIPKEKKSFSDESGNSSYKIISKDFVNSTIEIKIFCDCDHKIEQIIDIKNIPIDYLLYGSKFKRYRHKFICNSCERLFFIPLKLNELHTKNPQKTVREHYKEIELIEDPQNYSPTIHKEKDNQDRIKSFQVLIELNKQRRIYLLSRKYEEINLTYEGARKLISDESSLEYLEEMQAIDNEAISFLKNISKIIRDELSKNSKYEQESIKMQLKRKRWDYKRYREYKKKIHGNISQSIDLLKSCKFDFSIRYLDKCKKQLEFLTGFPVFNIIEDLLKTIQKISLEFIKFGLVDEIFRCFVNINTFYSKKKYNIACSEYDDFLHKLKDSKYYKQIRDKIAIIKGLHTEIQTEYYYVCIEKGDYYYKIRDKEAANYYKIAKNLVKHLFRRKGPLIVQLLRLIEESEQFY